MTAGPDRTAACPRCGVPILVPPGDARSVPLSAAAFVPSSPPPAPTTRLPVPAPASPSAVTVGQARSLQIGRYEVVGQLGRGAMGVVHRARDPGLGREVALKVMTDAGAGSDKALTRFRAEAQAAAKLRHPGIVGVLEVGEDEGRPFLAMELVRGETLGDLLGRGRVPPHRVAEIVRDVARALHHAHDNGVIHRDVKPANIFIDAEDGRPRLGDFGLARDLDRDGLTATGEMLGTPAFMAPEQADGSRARPGPPTVSGRSERSSTSP